ncbi:MAG: hypothetical protein NC207_08495 [Bacteroides sp.]|nr:hypothetical protein [Bacteroides sp.]
MTEGKNRRVPVWVTCIIIIAALPALLIPTFISLGEQAVEESKRLFLWLFPFYLVVAAYLAWQCYGHRTVMSWILITIMVITDLAMTMLMTI